MNLKKGSDYKNYSVFLDLIEENFTQKKHVTDYVKMMGITTKTLNIATRRVSGISAKDLINKRIILEIKRLLSLGELLLFEISNELGFDEPSNMTKFFKRYTGTSPKNFIKNS